MRVNVMRNKFYIVTFFELKKDEYEKTCLSKRTTDELNTFDSMSKMNEFD